jgi:hypothetical protein
MTHWQPHMARQYQPQHWNSSDKVESLFWPTYVQIDKAPALELAIFVKTMVLIEIRKSIFKPSLEAYNAAIDNARQAPSQATFKISMRSISIDKTGGNSQVERGEQQSLPLVCHC